jgi:predicted nucleic acid-binding protein
LDTSIFIYQIEANPDYVDFTDRIFNWLKAPKSKGCTSTITMLEVLVQPYRESEEERVDSLYALLSTYPNLAWIDTSLEIADRAARLRAQHNLRTPDAIQAATALAYGATGLVSNDPVFRRVPDLEILIIDDVRIV